MNIYLEQIVYLNLLSVTVQTLNTGTKPRGYKTFFQLSMKFLRLINLKLLTTANSFLQNIALKFLC